MGGIDWTEDYVEKAVLVGIWNRKQSEAQLKDYLDELEFLVRTAGADTYKHFTQNVETPNARTFIGSGKLAEIRDYVKEHEIDMVVFDDELTATQFRNVEKEINGTKSMNVKVLDRTNLILDIFARHARTSHARTQVELAQYQYLLPRLTRMWTHLERQKGGIGMRGPGETQIETDRRIIQQKIANLKEKLAKIDKQMAVQRGNRGKLVRVALVGYTNVGKSTIMNTLGKSEVLAQNKLFATLDTTVRKVVIDNIPFLLADTVGFIRKLPHQLVESFKSTLDEVREADLLLHVVDISHPNFEDHYNVVTETLAELGVQEMPTIVVFNKLDLFKEEWKYLQGTELERMLDELRSTWMARLGDKHTVFISAEKKLNMDEFKSLLYSEVRKIHVQRFPYNDFLY